MKRERERKRLFSYNPTELLLYFYTTKSHTQKNIHESIWEKMRIHTEIINCMIPKHFTGRAIFFFSRSEVLCSTSWLSNLHLFLLCMHALCSTMYIQEQAGYVSLYELFQAYYIRLLRTDTRYRYWQCWVTQPKLCTLRALEGMYVVCMRRLVKC